MEAKNRGKQDHRSQLPGRPSVVITKANLGNQWHDIRAHSVATKIYTPTAPRTMSSMIESLLTEMEKTDEVKRKDSFDTTV